MKKKMSNYTFTELDDADFEVERIPEIIYKYRDWDKEKNKRFITEREVYMSSPSDFLDKKDCKNPTRYDLLDKKQTVLFGLNLSKIKYPHYTRQQHRNEARKFEKEGLLRDKRYIDDFLKQYDMDYNSRLGVLSLTAFPCLEKMWHDYANESTGFCLGYNSKILFSLLGGGSKVYYEDELPIILPEPFMPFYEARIKRLYFKERHWSYEEEYRTDIFSEIPLTIIDRQIKLPFEAYNKIILGKNITEKTKTDIIKAVRENIGDIPIFEYEKFKTVYSQDK
jgi:hypothetical protein